jgi:SSS family solute:Na+ symporter
LEFAPRRQAGEKCMTIKILTILFYLVIVAYLAYKGWKETSQASDYMVAGRKMHPFVMAMSYGATFISTSAIIGFGGAAAMFGFPLLWLTFLTIFVGVFLAMVFLGKRTRRMGVSLDAHTFPELLGRRYQSRFMQGGSGVIIFLFIPVYAAAVLIGISRMIEVSFGFNFDYVIIVFTAIVAVYVIMGGLKAVMYTDAFQGSIMFFMMIIFLVFTYQAVGGVITGHEALGALADRVPENLQKGGVIGWTQGAKFGSPLWMTIYTTIIYGVGIGVLAQPQLAVRFMTVRSDRELNRGVLFGGIFILAMTGAAFVTGALSNVVFVQHTGKIAIEAAHGNMDKIIPTYIEGFFPDWFGTLFLCAMFAAAMSTLSSQYHVGGTSLGRDFYERGLGRGGGDQVSITRIGVGITILFTLIWGLLLPANIIAIATAFFFGLCAAVFLPCYMLGLYWKGITKHGALASMLTGVCASLFLVIFVHYKQAEAIGLCDLLFGVPSLALLAEKGSRLWLMQFADPNIIALPISFVVAIVGSLLTPKLDQAHIEECWRDID